MKQDAVTLQLISNALAYASEEMGLALRNAAYSPNIRERMDHSAAVFDRRGRLLAQAEHVPVHLGSLPWGMSKLLPYCARHSITMEEGSMVVSNNPYLTGTHLNDVTLVAPIYHRGDLVAFVVNKAHHSDVGGKSPGSISVDAKSLEEEGFVIQPMQLMSDGHILASAVECVTTGSRTPAERKGDLLAQVAANVTGKKRVLALISKYGAGAFKEAGTRAIRHSETLARRRISRIRPGTYSASDFLESPDGKDLEIRVRVKVAGSSIDIDYKGTSGQVGYPLNAVMGVTVSGAYFVARCLLGDDIPANHGAFAPVSVHAPVGSILNPRPPHPVGGGNVETSQRNADVLFRAFSQASPEFIPAAAGGSMNNVMMGGVWRSSSWAFYETIGVGLGGNRTQDGVDGIQCNMTNTMNTPIEEMERTYPVLMTRYEFRPDSCGPGERRGGCGLVRSYKMKADSTAITILADRGTNPPWGLFGGGPGERTVIMVRRGSSESSVPVKSTLKLNQGDEVTIMTAGGGGYGTPKSRRRDAIRKDVKNGMTSKRFAKSAYSFP